VDATPQPRPSETVAAGELATSRVPRAAPAEVVDDVRRGLAGERFESAAAVAVIEAGRLTGIVPLRDLLAADPAATVGEIARPAPTILAAETRIEPTANRVAREGEVTVAVHDAEGTFVGLVPPERLLGLLSVEHQEDLARLGGFRSSVGRAREAAEERVARRLWHRLPWLLIGLAGAMVASVIVGSFEEQLDRVVLLAFFVPAIVYMADSVGTQTETLLIRALSVDIHLGTVLRRELLTGAVLGATVAVVFYPFALLGWGNGEVALAVALALFCSCSIATLTAMGLPLAFQRLGVDPAFGSGPLATVIQDLLSITIYFAIAVPIAT
jgi:magnesium transporter